MQENSPVVDSYESAKPRANVVRVLFGIYFILNLFLLIALTITPTDNVNNLFLSSPVIAIQWVASAISLLTSIFFLMWIHRIYKNMSLLGDSYLRMTPGWAVGWYFIPIANLFKPYLGMKDVWNSCDPENDIPRNDGPALIKWWWAFWLLSSLSFNSNFPSIALVVLYFYIGKMIATLIATILAYLVVTKLTERQEQKWQKMKSELQQGM